MRKIFVISLILCMLGGASVYADSPALRVSSASGSAGDTIEISVAIESNPGIAAFNLQVGFDKSALTPVSIAKGAAISTGDIISNLQDRAGADTVTAFWVNPSDMSNNGILFSVKFKILEGTTGQSPVKVSYSEGDICNQKLETIHPDIINGNVTIKTKIDGETPGGNGETPGGDGSNPPGGNDGNSGDPSDGNGGNPSDGNGSNPSGGNSNNSLASGNGGTAAEIKIDPTADTPLSTLPNDTQALNQSVYFKDIGAYGWAAEAINSLAAEGIIKGTSADTFSPAAPVTRAMFVSLLYRIDGEPAVQISAAFNDVTDSAYYYDAVNWAAQNGIVSGIGGGMFAPNSDITREQAATILMRYLTYAHVDYAVTEEYRIFADEDEISAWAKNAVQTLNKLGIINGKGGGIIDPQGSATRAEAAVILYRFKAAAGHW